MKKVEWNLKTEDGSEIVNITLLCRKVQVRVRYRNFSHWNFGYQNFSELWSPEEF